MSSSTRGIAGSRTLSEKEIPTLVALRQPGPGHESGAPEGVYIERVELIVPAEVFRVRAGLSQESADYLFNDLNLFRLAV